MVDNQDYSIASSTQFRHKIGKGSDCRHSNKSNESSVKFPVRLMMFNRNSQHNSFVDSLEFLVSGVGICSVFRLVFFSLNLTDAICHLLINNLCLSEHLSQLILPTIKIGKLSISRSFVGHTL